MDEKVIFSIKFTFEADSDWDLPRASELDEPLRAVLLEAAEASPSAKLTAFEIEEVPA